MDQIVSDPGQTPTPAVSQEVTPVDTSLDKIEAHDVGGRPTKMTDETVQKLKQAFMMGCNDLQACLFADISLRTLANYQSKHPEFVQAKTVLKENPILKAKDTVMKNIDKVEHAKWVLEKYDRGQVSPGIQQNTQVNVFGELKDKYKKPEVIVETSTERPDGNKDGD